MLQQETSLESQLRSCLVRGSESGDKRAVKKKGSGPYTHKKIFKSFHYFDLGPVLSVVQTPAVFLDTRYYF